MEELKYRLHYSAGLYLTPDGTVAKCAHANKGHRYNICTFVDNYFAHTNGIIVPISALR